MRRLSSELTCTPIDKARTGTRNYPVNQSRGRGATICCVCLNPAIEIAFRAPEGWASAGELITDTDFAVAAGGKGTNVARVLWQLGHERTRLFYFTSMGVSP